MWIVLFAMGLFGGVYGYPLVASKIGKTKANWLIIGVLLMGFIAIGISVIGLALLDLCGIEYIRQGRGKHDQEK